ncbi:MAG: 30S ribosomal protein S6 [FCB group bacterium]|nr:30S ribosomal protein S6 [FCB group bacterium]
MRYYETMIIIHPALDSARLKEIIVGMQENLSRKGGEVRTTELWGRRRLAYIIDKQRYGTYVLLQYAGEGIRSVDFNVDLEHDPNILAYMTIKIEENDIHEQPDDLDTQIAGTVKDDGHVSDKDEAPKDEAAADETDSADESSDEDVPDKEVSDDDSVGEETDDAEKSEAPESEAAEADTEEPATEDVVDETVEADTEVDEKPAADLDEVEAADEADEADEETEKPAEK